MVTGSLDKASGGRTAPATKKVNQVGQGATSAVSGATKNVGATAQGAGKNVSNTAGGAMGDLAQTGKDTASAVQRRDIKGVGTGVAKVWMLLQFLRTCGGVLTFDRVWDGLLVVSAKG